RLDRTGTVGCQHADPPHLPRLRLGGERRGEEGEADQEGPPGACHGVDPVAPHGAGTHWAALTASVRRHASDVTSASGSASVAFAPRSAALSRPSRARSHVSPLGYGWTTGPSSSGGVTSSSPAEADSTGDRRSHPRAVGQVGLGAPPWATAPRRQFHGGTGC